MDALNVRLFQSYCKIQWSHLGVVQCIMPDGGLHFS
jgi:hypothetical protein